MIRAKETGGPAISHEAIQFFFFHVRVERCCEAQLGQLASHPNEKTTEEMLYRLGLVAYRDARSALFLVTHVHSQWQGKITNDKVGDTSSNGWFSLVILVFPSVNSEVS